MPVCPQHSNVRAISPRHAAGDNCRCCTAVVVVAPTTRTSAGYMYVRLKIFRLQIMCVESGNTHNIEYGVQRAQNTTSRAHSDADPGLVGPTATAAAVLLLEKLCCRCCTAAVVVVAPATRSSCWTCHIVEFSSRKYYADFRGGKQET